MGELTARDDDKIRVSDNRSDIKVGTLLWKKLGQNNIAKLSRMHCKREKEDSAKIRIRGS
ncbi:MAG: hypothetical protein KC440_00045 [Nitrosarchaeum sp.]|nr:hypothetical protein [Nitrosarchaeum sp.]